MRVDKIISTPPVHPKLQIKERGTRNDADTENAVDNDVSHNNDQAPNHAYKRYTPQKQVVATEEQATIEVEGLSATDVKHLNVRA